MTSDRAVRFYRSHASPVDQEVSSVTFMLIAPNVFDLRSLLSQFSSILITVALKLDSNTHETLEFSAPCRFLSILAIQKNQRSMRSMLLRPSFGELALPYHHGVGSHFWRDIGNLERKS